MSPRIIVREPNDRGGSYSQPLSSQGPGSVGPRIIVREPHDTGGPSARVDPQLPPNGIGIGIETEFLLAPQSDKLKASTTDGFVTKLAKLYNGEVKSRHPRMSTQRGVATVNGVYGQVWALVFDGSIIKNKASDSTY